MQKPLKLRNSSSFSVKVNIVVCSISCIDKFSSDGQYQLKKGHKYFGTSNYISNKTYNIQKVYSDIVNKILCYMSVFERGFKWVIIIGVNINVYNQLRANGFIQLPSCYRYKRDILNIENDHRLCFL